MAGELARAEPARSVHTVAAPAAATDEAAFARFYAANIATLTRSLAISLGNDQLAQEAAQEAMVRACERWEKISRYDNPAGWCYRVATNWATSRWRKRRREVITAEPRNGALPGVQINPDIELKDRIVAALATLPTEQRSVIVLRLIEDWSIAQTAEALGIAAGTVQSRYARALRRLQSELGDVDE